MKNNLTWQDVLKRDDIIGGELEINEGSYKYRGPIRNIQIENGKVYIELSWAARMSIDPNMEGWKAWHITCFSVPANTLPTDIGNGRVSFGMSRSGFNIILPKDDKKLDPGKVKGLKV